MSTKTLWISPTDWVTGDSTLQISYPSVTHPAVEITTTVLGDLKWVFLGLRLSVDSLIRAVRVCYQLSSSNSFISQVRLTEMQTPDSALVRHDDPTDLLSTIATCYVSQVGAYHANGAVTLALRLKFANAGDKITLGPVGVDVETCGIDVANIKCFGAVGDGMANDTKPIQKAIKAVEDAGGGIVYFPAGTYLTNEPLRIKHDSVTLRGEGRDVAVVKNTSSDLLHFSDTSFVRYFVLEDIQLKSSPGGGHIIVVPIGMNQSTIRAAHLAQHNNAKSIYRLIDPINEQGHGGYNNLVTETWLQGPLAPTVPQWHVVVNGTRFNSNTFERVRCDHSGAFFFHLESMLSQAPLSGNSFRDITFESCVGGKIKLLSCVGTLLQECVAYDDLAPITNDGFYVGRSSSSISQSTYTTFINCDRRSGSLSDGFKDIKVAPGECLGTTVINCGGTPGAGVTHDFGGTPVTAIGMPAFVTLEGTAQTTMVSSDGIATSKLSSASSPVFDVTHHKYGAVGDGTTNDGNAITKVHDALPATGGIVYFPSGTYVFSSALTWNKSKAVLRGAGMWQSTLKLQNLNGTERLLELAAFVENLVVEDLCFDGNGSFAVGLFRMGGSRANSITFRRCRFTNFTGRALHIIAAGRITIEDCYGHNPAAYAGQGWGVFVTGGAQRIVCRRNRWFWLNQGLVFDTGESISDDDDLIDLVDIHDETFDAYWWLLPAQLSNSGGSVSYTAASLVDNSAPFGVCMNPSNPGGIAFGAYPNTTYIRAMQIIHTGTLGSTSQTSVSDASAQFITGAIPAKRGDMVRVEEESKFAVVNGVESPTVLRIEEWLDETTLSPTSPPPMGTPYMAYNIILGYGTALSADNRTVTTSRWRNFDGDDVLPPNGTRYEVLRASPRTHILAERGVRNLRMRGCTLRRGWADQALIRARWASIVDNTFMDGQDMNLTLSRPLPNGGTGVRHQVIVNRMIHAGASNLNFRSSDHGIIAHNQMSGARWLHRSPTGARDAHIHIVDCNRTRVSNNIFTATESDYARYGISLEHSPSDACEANKLEGNDAYGAALVADVGVHGPNVLNTEITGKALVDYTGGAVSQRIGEPVTLNPDDFMITAGSPAQILIGGLRPAWAFGSSNVETVSTNFFVPALWTNISITILWTSLTPSSGNVRWVTEGAQLGEGDDITLPGTINGMTVTAPAQNILKKSVIAGGMAVDPGELMNLAVKRETTHPEDTLASSAAVLAALIERA
jgi:hypothetical protein